MNIIVINDEHISVVTVSVGHFDILAIVPLWPGPPFLLKCFNFDPSMDK